MNTIRIPDECQRSLTCIEADPLAPGREALAHLQTCPACAEARVWWLAQEDWTPALVPADYFEKLPRRVLGKLPAPRSRAPRRGAWVAAAAALMLCTAGAAFWAGRVNRSPLVEASLPKGPGESEPQPETPFRDRDEALVQLQSLSPDEAAALLKRLEQSESKP
ncbi:MAG: hypothetical protein HY823_01660 [Acidobacteria bacterium]|nr:hypothetical protein [Acidobacteriota bacterium]